MRVVIKWHVDMWQEIKDSALFTIHKGNGKYPDSVWKKKILLAEHSPIRDGRIIIELYDVPSFVIGHLVRHNVGFTPFVSSLREDRADYDKVPDRNTPNNLRFDGNFQSFINISRKRLCNCASKETREVWQMVKDEIAKVEPELASCMVRECIYRGFCPEMYSCEYDKTGRYERELTAYRDRNVNLAEENVCGVCEGSGYVMAYQLNGEFLKTECPSCNKKEED